MSFKISGTTLLKYEGSEARCIIPNGVKEIGTGAFACCDSLESVVIPSGVLNIEDGAFRDCRRLKSVRIQGAVTLGHRLFEDCSALESVSFPDGVRFVGRRAFFRCSALKSVSLSCDDAFIEEEAFSECTSLESVSISGYALFCGNDTFKDCRSLKSVSLENSRIDQITPGTFEGCRSLKTVTLPASVTLIWERAFAGCGSLKEIFYGGNASALKMREGAFDRRSDGVSIHSLGRLQAEEKARSRVEALSSSVRDSSVRDDAAGSAISDDELVSYFEMLAGAEKHASILESHLADLHRSEAELDLVCAEQAAEARSKMAARISAAKKEVESSRARVSECRSNMMSARMMCAQSKTPEALERLIPVSRRFLLPAKPVMPKKRAVSLPMTAPEPPQFEKPGLFGRKKAEERNAQLQAEYERKLAEYEDEKKRLAEEEEAAYQAKVKDYEEKLAAYYDELKPIALEIVADDGAKAERSLERAESWLEGVLREAEAAENQAEAPALAFVKKEVAELEECLTRVLKVREGLYGRGVVHPKYRNLLAVCTIYDYLSTGRCEGLTGPHGAYNLYESEMRSNLIIGRLESIEGKLDDIRDIQYSAYVALTSVQQTVSSLTSTMQDAVSELSTVSSNVKSVNESAKATAYHAEAAAYYAKVNAEIAAAPSFGIIF